MESTGLIYILATNLVQESKQKCTCDSFFFHPSEYYGLSGDKSDNT